MTRLAMFMLALFTMALPARADQAIDVDDAWIRYLPGDRPMAGYFVASNPGSTDRRLVGASSPAFGAVHMHRSMEQDGTTGMQPVDSVVLPKGGSVSFEPGGYHLMLMQPSQELNVGDPVSVTLELDGGVKQSVTFTIKPAWQE